MKAKDIQRIEELGLSKATETYFRRNHFAVQDLIAGARDFYIHGHYSLWHTQTPDGKGRLVSKERVIELVECVKAIGLTRDDMCDTADLANRIDQFYRHLALSATTTHVVGARKGDYPYTRKPYNFRERFGDVESSAEYNELYESYTPIKVEQISGLKGAIAAKLTARDYYIVMLRYGLESGVRLDIKAVAEKMHLSRDAIIKITSKAMRDLSRDYAFPRFSELFGGEPESFEGFEVPEVITGDTEIEYLNLTIRSYNVLKRDGYNTVRDIADCSNDKFLNIRNMNKKSIAEISGIMVDLGYESFKPLLESCS